MQFLKDQIFYSFLEVAQLITRLGFVLRGNFSSLSRASARSCSDNLKLTASSRSFLLCSQYLDEISFLLLFFSMLALRAKLHQPYFLNGIPNASNNARPSVSLPAEVQMVIFIPRTLSTRS